MGTDVSRCLKHVPTVFIILYIFFTKISHIDQHIHDRETKTGKLYNNYYPVHLICVCPANKDMCRGPSAVSALNMLRAGPIHVAVTR